MLNFGQRVYAAPTGILDPASGMPVYEATCGFEDVPGVVGMRTAFGVPQAKLDASNLPIYAVAKCTEGQSLAGRRVVAIPTGKIDSSGTPVYAFSCCPGGAQSGSGSGSGLGPAVLPSESGSGSGSGGGGGAVLTPCCTGVPIPATLHATFTSASCTAINGLTVPLTFTSNIFSSGLAGWAGTVANIPSAGVTFYVGFACFGSGAGSTFELYGQCQVSFLPFPNTWSEGFSASVFFGTAVCSPFSANLNASGPGNIPDCCSNPDIHAMVTA